ncbi:12719_t:CDS:10 [Ambispora gerdemannii]|uniref:12719_t:CDS:1 n=1 Tax=Ambispora gerdemannii TaxID=144530 RepID=A0A9N9BD20_9GLOM|nr:12719_t:CDS:10 [Ambispora gerdemannii]
MDKNNYGNTSPDSPTPLKYSKYLSAYLSQTRIVDQGTTVASSCDVSKENESPAYSSLSSSTLSNSLMLSSRNWDLKKLISKVDNIAHTLDETLIIIRGKSSKEKSFMDELKHLREAVSQYSQLDESIKRMIEKTQVSLKSEITQELLNQITAQLSEFRQELSKIVEDNTQLQEIKYQATFQSVAESQAWNLVEIRNELNAHRQLLDAIIEQNKSIFQLHERYLLDFQNREILKEMNSINNNSNRIFKDPMIDNDNQQHKYQLSSGDDDDNNNNSNELMELPSLRNLTDVSRASERNSIVSSDSDIARNTTTSFPRIQNQQPSNNITNTSISEGKSKFKIYLYSCTPKNYVTTKSPTEKVARSVNFLSTPSVLMVLTASTKAAAQLVQAVSAAFNFKSTSLILPQIKQHLGWEGVNSSNDNDDEDKSIVDKKHIKWDSETTSNGGTESAKRNGPDMPVQPHYRSPRLPIVLCHGLFGFDKLGPASLPQLQIHYWGGVQEALQKIGAQVVVTKVPRTGGIRSRARELHRILESNLAGTDVNLLAHSMGGLDCRYLIAHLPTEKCTIRTLTTVATPHRGSPFMDWCRDNFGVGVVPDSFGATAKAVDETMNRLENGSHKDQQRAVSSDHDNEESIFSKYRKLVSQSGNKDSSSGTRKIFPLSIPIPNMNFSIPSIPVPNINLPQISLPNISLPNLNVSLALSSTLASTTAIINPLTRLLIQAVDAPAYSNLTTDYCTNHFNPNTPNHPSVAYYSYGAAADIPGWSPLHFPYQIIKAKEGLNDGLVSVKSAQWGRYIQTVDCDHWDLTDRWRTKIGANKFDPVEFYLHAATFLAKEGY